jgi:hypothetical protein
MFKMGSKEHNIIFLKLRRMLEAYFNGYVPLGMKV